VTVATVLSGVRAEALCPYVGLVPFDEDQASYFFGRERDTQLLADNLTAYRLTLLYGASGCGKSSILNAGVIPALRRDLNRGLYDAPPALVVSLSTWRDHPRSRLHRELAAAARAAGKDVDLAGLRDLPLREALVAWAGRLGAELYLIFDQFEEYFLYQADLDEGFAVEFADAVSGKDVPAQFLVAIREDALAKLDVFQGRIPNLFDNYYRLQHLDSSQARQAMEGPVAKWNELHPDRAPMSIAKDLVDAVLDQVRAGQVQVGPTGEGHPSPVIERDAIETAHLQLVMSRIWQAETEAGSRALRLETLADLGGAPAIVRSHLETSMQALSEEEQRFAAEAFRQLVTPSGTKIAHRADDLAEYAGVDRAALAAVLDRLASGDIRILRPVPPAPGHPDELRYEIFHDALGPAILAWLERRRRADEESEARAELAAARALARRERRRRVVLSGLVVLLTGALVAAVVLFLQSRSETRRRKSEELANEALAEIPTDPIAASRIALSAWNSAHTGTAERAIRRVAPKLHAQFGLTGHRGDVTAATFSPDGAQIATSSVDDTVRLWNAATGSPLGNPLRASGAVLGVRFSHAGTRLLAWDANGHLNVWEATTGAPAHAPFGGPATAILDARWSQDDSEILARAADGSVRLFRSSDGMLLRELDTGRATAIAFLDDPASTPVTGNDHGEVRAWTSPTEVVTQRIPPANDTSAPVTAIATQNGVIAAADERGDGMLWNLPTGGGVVSLLTPTRAAVNSLAFRPDGSGLAGGSGKYVVQWAVPSEPTHPLSATKSPGHTAEVTAAAFTFDGRYLVSASQDGTALVRDAVTGAVVSELIGHRGPINTVDLDRDNRVVTASHDGTALLWDSPTTVVFRGASGTIASGAVTPDGRLVVTRGEDGVRSWDVATVGAGEHEMSVGEGTPGPLAVDPRDANVVVTATDATATVWDLDKESPLKTWRADRVISGLAFAPDASAVAVTTDDGRLHVWRWDDPGANFVRSVPAGTFSLSVSWSPDGRTIATGDEAGTVTEFDAASLERGRSWRAHADRIVAIVFSPESKQLLTASTDRTAAIWTTSGRAVHVLTTHDVPLASAAWNGTGSRVVTGGVDGTVAVWSVESGKNLTIFRPHNDAVTMVALLQENSVLSADADGTLRLDQCSTCGSVATVATGIRARLERMHSPPAQGSRAAPAAGNALGPGVCFPEGTADVRKGTPVACMARHRYEVYATFDLVGLPDAFPEDGSVQSAADRLCGELFSAYTGGSTKIGQMATAQAPQQATWNAGDRAVVCVLDAGRVVQGSARASGG
jgi:WD40 repeat protein